MKKETLAKAHKLEDDINLIEKALTVCGNSKHFEVVEHYGGGAERRILPKQLNQRLLVVLGEEFERLKHELENLTDDNVNEQVEFQPTGKYSVATAVQEKQSVHSTDKNYKKLGWCIVAMWAWLIFCIVYTVMGFGTWITAGSNTLFSIFMIYFASTERNRLKVKKEN